MSSRPLVFCFILGLMAVLLVSCKQDRAAGPAQASSSSAPPSVATAAAAVSASPAGSSEATAASPSSKPDHQVITDIASWDHPVKAVIDGAPFNVKKVELTRQSTYPIFYVDYPNAEALDDDPVQLFDYLERIAKANAYWDFELRNEDDHFDLQIKVDKTNKTLASVLLNGEEEVLPAAQCGNWRAAEFLFDRVPGLDRPELSCRKANLTPAAEDELVYAISNSEQDEYDGVYIVQPDGKGFKQLAYEETLNGYTTVDLQIVPLADRKEQALLLTLSNDVEMTGFRLIGYRNGQLEQLAYSASATGAGRDELTDSDGDGKYDGYVLRRFGYDVLNFEVTRYYALKNGEFVPTATTVPMGDYPAEAEEAAKQYIKLQMLAKYWQSADIDNRLKELCPTCAKQTIAVDDDLRMLGDTHGIDDAFSELNKAASDASADRTFRLTYGEGDSRSITLRLTQRDGRWVVRDVKQISG